MTVRELNRRLGKGCSRVYLVKPSQAAEVQAMAIGGWRVTNTDLVCVMIPEGYRRNVHLLWVRDWLAAGELVRLADGTIV